MMNEKKVREGLELIKSALKMNSTPFPEFSVDNLNNGIEIVEEALAPTPRLYKDQQVLVRDMDHDNWEPATFTKRQKLVLSETSYPYLVFDPRKGRQQGYAQCKPDPEAKSLINWTSFKANQYPIEKPGYQIVYSTCGEYHASVSDPEFL